MPGTVTPRTARIVTSSLGTLEQVTPPFNLSVPRFDENVQRASEILEAAVRYQPDLVLLPETFAMAGMPSFEVRKAAEESGGPTAQMLSAMARKGRMNLVAGHMVREGERVFNRALVFARDGKLVGSYDKMHPVGNEALAGVTPGAGPGTFDLDFGRIGVSICFDINWPVIWKEMAGRRIDLACWLSAYDGGFPLRSYAWQHQYPIVSSVCSYHARLYDITGEETTLTSRWQRVGFVELNLDRALFHTDNQMHALIAIQAKYGARIRLRTFTEEHLFTLESLDPELGLSDVIAEFQLEKYRDYIDRCSK
jgi:predicted amidohydrolase